jgi:hypothetical protein
MATIEGPLYFGTMVWKLLAKVGYTSVLAQLAFEPTGGMACIPRSTN